MSNDKNVLIINGSPLKTSRVEQIALALTAGMQKNGYIVDTLDIKALTLKHCIGCMQCQKDQASACSIRDDDIGLIEEKIRNANILVIASPVHWGNMSSYMLQMFERLYGFLMQERAYIFPPKQFSKGKKPFLVTAAWPAKRAAKGKKAIFITACSTQFPFNWVFNQSRATFARLKEICKYSGIKVVKKIVLTGTNHKQSLSNKFLAKIEQLGKNMRM